MAFSIQVVQSTPICIILSAIGGAIEVLATAILAYKDAVECETGRKWSRAASICALAANVFLQVTSSILGNLFAPWFGPVSLVGPIFLCAQLVANMIIFGYILGLESFNKDMKVGTYVVVIGVILLPVVGPAAQEDQDIAALLGHWYSLAWSGVLVFGMLVSLAFLLVLKFSMLRESYRIVLLLVARASAFSVNLTVSKLMVLDVSMIVLITSIVLKITSGLVITYACIVQASAVPQATFAPLNASALIVVNAITGMIVWEDWRVVGSWLGYACIFVQLILGNYLLLGDIALFSPDNQKYGRARAIELATGSIVGTTVCAVCGDDAASLEDDETDGYYGGQELTHIGKHTGYEVSKDGDAYEYWEDEVSVEARVPPSRAQAQRATRRRSARRLSVQEAWRSVYGLRANVMQHRRKSLFSIETDSSITSEADALHRRGSF
jgi:MFS family permease